MVEFFLRKRERFFQEGHGPFVMKRQQGPGRFLHFLFLRRLGLGQKLGIPRAGIVAAQFPGFVEHVLQHLSVHGTGLFLHVAGKSGQQAFQVSPGAQAFQKSLVFSASVPSGMATRVRMAVAWPCSAARESV